MSAKRLLFSDGVHLTTRNFATLIDFFASRGINPHIPKHDDFPIDCHGDYEVHAATLERSAESLSCMDIEDALRATHIGINLFDVCRAEALSLLITREPWISRPLPTDRAALFSAMWAHSRRTLTLNMAAAMYWIEFWSTYTKLKLNPDYVCVFSGSLIYARSLLEVMKSRPGRVFVVESFFTGNEYYLEERYEPIANRTDLRFAGLQKALVLPPNRRAYEIQRNIAFSSIRNMKNKNVKQPPTSGQRVFSNKNRSVLVLGQVLNDFSLLEYKGVGLCSIDFYIRFVEAVLRETDLNVIFKAHPWETEKSNLRSPVTLDFLSERFRDVDRVRLVSDWPIGDLFREAECVATINSQSGIEAALAGFKVLQVGDAFWGNKGFTHDLGLHEERDWLNALCDPDHWRLRIAGYDRLEEFLTRALRMWLVGEKSDPTGRLTASFYELPRVSKPVAAATKTNSKPPARPAATSTPNPSPVATNGAIAPVSTRQHSNAPLEIPRHLNPPASVTRKLRKLMTHPREFFRDSRHPALRAVARLAPSR